MYTSIEKTPSGCEDKAMDPSEAHPGNPRIKLPEYTKGFGPGLGDFTGEVIDYSGMGVEDEEIYKKRGQVPDPASTKAKADMMHQEIICFEFTGDGPMIPTLSDLARVLEALGEEFLVTGNKLIIMNNHMKKMKDNGHFVNGIDMRGLGLDPGVKVITSKPLTDVWVFQETNSGIFAPEQCLMNLGCATGHPSFDMSGFFTNPLIAQLKLWLEKDERKVHVLPKHLDEKVAALPLGKLGAKLSKEQADYNSVRATDVPGDGDVGKGCAAVTNQAGFYNMATMSDPNSASQAIKKWFQDFTLEDAVSEADIKVNHMKKMKDNGHFVDGIDMRGLGLEPGVKVHVLAMHLDEKVAAVPLGKLGPKLTKLSKEQADYISVLAA